MSSKSVAVAMLFFVLAAASPRLCAQTDRTIVLLVKDAPGAPTPAQIVDYSNTWPHAAPPPLTAFDIADPRASYYLMADRASGDFLAWLEANPHSLRKKLEDYVLVTFNSAADTSAALTALKNDPEVEAADIPLAMDFRTARLSGPTIDALAQPESTQYGWDDMNLAAAWQITGGGYALVGQIDMGLDRTHPALMAFDGPIYVGGNFLSSASKDVGLTGFSGQAGFDPTNVDEAKAELIPASPCTPIDALLPPTHLGHGTHVAGLLGANGDAAPNVRGTCKHCGIAEYRTAFLECRSDSSPAQILPSLNSNAASRGEVEAVDAGAQALSLSFGARNDSASYKCAAYRNFPNCLAIAYASSRDAAIVASSGNEREELNFPASDQRVVSAGGFQSDSAFWDDSPGDASNCPPEAVTECGSNFSKLHGAQYLTHQELLASAKRVLSTTYPNTTWVDYAECGDGYGTPAGDGIGWCTGTSMSTPQIAGAIGLLRSIAPLVSMSTPEPPGGIAPGVRTVAAQTASQAEFGQSWNSYRGYGIPDVAAAARRMLGKVAGGGVRNRATPLFRLYSAYAKDFAETTSPQYALSLMIAQAHNYVQPAIGLGAQPPVPGYAFPYDADSSDTYYESSPAAPRAAMYVLTTDVKPRADWPALLPLHMMDRPKAGGHDYLLVTTKSDIEAAHAGGYDLRTLQGYVFQPCTPEPACVPPLAQAVYRACNDVANDCATFLESERAPFEAAGYTNAYPAGSVKKLGYAYPASDTDNDQLPDGFELAVGTDPTRADTDNDGVLDGAEMPLAGVPVSDPCAGGAGAVHCPGDRIFANGFEGF